MKHLSLKNVAFLSICIATIAFSSCNDSDDSKIDESFILKTNDSIPNSNELTFVMNKINLIGKNEYLKTNNSDSIQSSARQIGTIVSLKNEVSKLFDPENHPCSLPSKIARKLKNSKDDGKPWAPKFVVGHISQMPDSVICIPRESISNILHRVTIKKVGTTSTFQWLATGSPTYNDLNVEDFILTGYNSFFYSLDCSGYLNAAIEGSGAVPGADIKAVAKSALETQNSMFIGGGVIVSPLCAAYYGNLVSMDTITRINILRAITSIPNTSDNDVVEMDLSFNAVWASKTGTSSFNGKADLKTNAGAGIGMAQISSSSSGGGAISRKSAFSSFNTYITKDNPLNNPSEITIAKIKAVLQTLADNQ